jgi:hypothetical protein
MMSDDMPVLFWGMGVVLVASLMAYLVLRK